MNARREGFTLMEVIVSMVLLSVILTTLAGLTFATARQAISTGNASKRQAVSLELVNRFTTLPYDSLSNYAGGHCDSVASGPDRFRRCVRAAASGAQTVVELSVRPLQHDTTTTRVRLVRMGAPPPSPLCNPSC
jgi:prepilin-type N-terminal cleavage/methylation domain-containing protein